MLVKLLHWSIKFTLASSRITPPAPLTVALRRELAKTDKKDVLKVVLQHGARGTVVTTGMWKKK